MSTPRIRIWLTAGLIAGHLAGAPAALAAKPAPKTTEQLQQELEDQRKLLLRILQMQQQHLDLLNRMVGEGGRSLPTTSDSALAPEPLPGREGRKGKAAFVPPVEKRGTIAGRLRLEGGDPTSAVIYVDNVAARPVSGVTVQMNQVSKQFDPRSLVVQRGTRVEFPNMDPVFHNVFSLSPANPFDLGTYRSGDSPRSVVFTRKGVVKVFCNLHPQMLANILVVPNGLFVRPAKDGSFRIPHVPAGRRRVVAWFPNVDAVLRDVQVVEAQDAAVDFTLSAPGAPAPHLNKFGQPYGSYKE
jgi:plastocyanin